MYLADPPRRVGRPLFFDVPCRSTVLPSLAARVLQSPRGIFFVVRRAMFPV